MKRRLNAFETIIIILIALGFITSLVTNLSAWLLPAIIFGVIFFLYKFPPSRWRFLMSEMFHQKNDGNTRKHSKKVPFRVIHGNKSADDEDHPPRYH